jgi:hypothetical protein
MNDRPAHAANDAPTPLPSEVMEPSESSVLQREMPLHLRVLRAIVEGQSEPERFDRALVIAQEVYELENANVALEDYRSAS